MTKLAISTIIAALLCPFSASAQTTVVQRCDKLVADAEKMGQTVSECFAGLASSRASLKALVGSTAGPEERILTSSTPLGVDLTRAAMTEPLHGKLIAYYAYTAFGSGDPSQCSALSAIGVEQANICRRAFAELGFIRSLQGAPSEMVKACRRTESDDGSEVSGETCCALIAENIRRPDACAKLSPKCDDAATCRAFVSSAAGSPRDCGALPKPPAGDCKGAECDNMHAETIANCEADAAFSRAFKAKDIAVCGTSERCRALMGAGKDVAQEIAAKNLKNPVGVWFLKSAWKTPSVVERSRAPIKPLPPQPAAAIKQLDFKGFVCAEPMFSKANRTAVAATINSAQACLTDIEAALSQPSKAVIDALDERKEKLIRLTISVDKQFEAAVKPTKPAAPAPK